MSEQIPQVRTGLALSLLILGLLLIRPAIAEDSDEDSEAPSASAPKIERLWPGEVDRSGTQPELATRWLADDIPAEQVRWINGAADSPQAVLGLYLAETHGQGQGGALIIPSQGQHPGWPGVVSALRLGLPDKGWHTLALSSLPGAETGPLDRILLAQSDPEFPYPNAPGRPGRGGPSADADNKESDGAETEGSGAEGTLPEELPDARAETNAETETLEASASGSPELASEAPLADVSLTQEGAEAPSLPPPGDAQRIEMGLQFLNSMGQLNLAVIGVDQGASAVLEYLGNLPVVPPRGLAVVWINAPFDEQALRALRDRQPQIQGVKVLDLYDGHSRAQQDLAKSRMGFARRHQLRAYEQVRLPGLGRLQSAQESVLVQRVSGWLKRVAPGRNEQARSL